MPQTVCICAVGLTLRHLGSSTPRLLALANAGRAFPMAGVVPAVTTTAQTSMLTGVSPQEHGIVANGWYFRELGEVWLWRQSEALVQAPHVWEILRRSRPGLRVLKHFWWYAMNSSCDGLVTPRPAYHADGVKSPDIYTWPPELKHDLQRRHGTFPLFSFWGPTAGAASSRWIAATWTDVADAVQPDLSLVYLPHLDYDLQRYGPSGPHLDPALRELDACVGVVADAAQARGAQVVVVSEYGITAVDTAVFINRRLREAGLLAVTRNATGELLDPGGSRAFAVVDHQLAHIYCRTPSDVVDAANALQGLEGLASLHAGRDRAALGLDHPRSGELVALAAPSAWFSYDYWLDPDRRPDFANLVEIHKKPGYDPRELAFDPHGGRRRAALALLRKKLGLRYRMAAVGTDPSVVRGSHGLNATSPDDGPILITPPGIEPRIGGWRQTDVAGLLGRLLEG